MIIFQTNLFGYVLLNLVSCCTYYQTHKATQRTKSETADCAPEPHTKNKVTIINLLLVVPQAFGLGSPVKRGQNRTQQTVQVFTPRHHLPGSDVVNFDIAQSLEARPVAVYTVLSSHWELRTLN